MLLKLLTDLFQGLSPPQISTENPGWHDGNGGLSTTEASKTPGV